MSDQVDLNRFSEVFVGTVELSSEAVGGQVLSVSDEHFAKAKNLLQREPSSSHKGQFGTAGSAVYDGWETRRHNKTYDWCIIKLGTTGRILGFDIDTSHFNGNEAPSASVETLFSSFADEPDVDDHRWVEILPRVKLGPTSRHLFTLKSISPDVNHVKLIIHPDGGIARFRVYGHVSPVFPVDVSEAFDLAHIFAGGHVECFSDQHYGLGSNLILPGRGNNIGDGWETARSRVVGHKDWVVIKLGAAGVLEKVQIDTAHFIGNYPESCEVHAAFFPDDPGWKSSGRNENEPDVGSSDRWTLVLPKKDLGPSRKHFFTLENTEGRTFTHIRLTIFPDGGVQRVRVLGRRSIESAT